MLDLLALAKLHTDSLTFSEVKFLNDVNNILARYIGSSQFSIAKLAREVHLSESQLRRKLVRLVGISPIRLLRKYRLDQARSLLIAGFSIKEVTFACGFASHSYFTLQFKKEFDMSPSDYYRMGGKIIQTNL